MARWKRMAACLLAAVLAVSLLAGTYANADGVDIYQLAENDQMVDLPLEAMPVWIGGSIYVPYHAFDWTYTKVNLGVSYGQEHTSTKYLFTLYSLNGTLVFDVNAGTCTQPSTGEDMDMKAVVRNGRVFVPLAGVCRYFGLSYSYTPTNYGTLIRITNGQEWLSTTMFVDSAASIMRSRYNEYMKLINASASPKPTTSGSSTSGPSASPEPSDQRRVTVALAVACTGVSPERILDELDSGGVKALFLFRPEDLESQEQAIRRAVGSGHTVGLLVTGTSAAAALEEAETGSRWLEGYLHLRPHILCLEQAGEGVAAELDGTGWVCWAEDIDARDDGSSQSARRSALLQTLGNEEGLVRVLLDDSSATAAMLPQTLSQMRGAGYTFHLTVESEL